MSVWYRADPEMRRITLTLHVQPNARANAIAGLHGDALKVKVAAPALDNKANTALLSYLREVLGLRPPQISLESGAHGRRKFVQISDADAALVARIAALARRA